MAGKLCGSALGCLLIAWSSAVAADEAFPGALFAQTQPAVPPPVPPRPAPAAQAPVGPGPMAPALAAAPRAPVEDEAAREGPNPHMIGDFPGLFSSRTVFVPALQITSTTQSVSRTTLVNVVVPQDGSPITVRVPVTTTDHVLVQQKALVEVPVTVRVPFPFGGDFKIAENESAAPENRVFFGYNYYSSVAGPGTDASLPHVATTSTTIAGNAATITTQTAGVPAPRIDLHREVVGFEKTFLGGDASFELRAPVVEQQGESAIDGSDVGDVTVVLKYAFLNDRRAGDVLAVGLALTLPTGPGLPLPGGKLHPTVLQPWGGYVWNYDRFFVQGFTSLAVPTDWRDVVLVFNDVSAGYTLYRSTGNRLISAVVPTLEAHVTTPLNHRDSNSDVTVPDLVVLTGGTHFEISQRATLSVGVAAPVTGPRAFDVEAVVQLNWRF